jgi:hypothetical protein
MPPFLHIPGLRTLNKLEREEERHGMSQNVSRRLLREKNYFREKLGVFKGIIIVVTCIVGI